MNKSVLFRGTIRSLMQRSDNGFLNAYKSFINDKREAFDIIYNREVLQKPEVLLVLDSSFNPPHWGHYTLVKKGLELYHQKSTQVLLLLSVNNADKAPKPASFDKRMEMMCLLADMMHEDGIAVSVGITVHGKYVDKFNVLRGFYKHTGIMSFLVGFDTLVRIFDAKYYSPQLPAEALRDFMSSTELCCLTREGEHPSKTQLEYASDIINGAYEPMIPRNWGEKIHIMENDERFESVSSSAIRKAVLAGCSFETLEKLTPSAIAKYIAASKDHIF